MFVPALTLALLFANAVQDTDSFKQGSQAYENLEFEQALFRFQRLAVSPGLDDSERASVLIWVALSYAGMGDERSAKQSLKDAVDFDDDAKLPVFAPPKVKEWMSDAHIAKARSKTHANTKSDGTSTAPDVGGTGDTETGAPDATNPENGTDTGTVDDGNSTSTGTTTGTTDSKTDAYSSSKSDAKSAEMGKIEIAPERPVVSTGPNLFMVGSGGALILTGIVSGLVAAIAVGDYFINIVPLLDGPSTPERKAEVEFAGNLDLISAVAAGTLGVVAVVGGGALIGFGLIE